MPDARPFRRLPSARSVWRVTDLDRMPKDGNRYEILHGELLVTPLPSNEHQGVAAPEGGVFMLRIALVATAVLTTACSTVATEGISCSDAGRAALAVVLVDRETGAVAPFSNAKVLARNDAHADSVTRTSIVETDGARSLNLLWGRPGAYAVTVTADGYEAWHSPFVTQNNLRCGSVTDTLIAPIRKRTN